MVAEEGHRQSFESAVDPMLQTVTGGPNGNLGLGMQTRSVLANGREQPAERIDELPGQGVLELAVPPDWEEHWGQGQLDRPRAEISLWLFGHRDEAGVREL